MGLNNGVVAPNVRFVLFTLIVAEPVAAPAVPDCCMVRLPVPAVSVQLLLGVVSPKLRLPTVLFPLMVTVRSDVMSRVLKSATAPIAFGIAGFQLATSVQVPLAFKVQLAA